MNWKLALRTPPEGSVQVEDRLIGFSLHRIGFPDMSQENGKELIFEERMAENYRTEGIARIPNNQ